MSPDALADMVLCNISLPEQAHIEAAAALRRLGKLERVLGRVGGTADLIVEWERPDEEGARFWAYLDGGADGFHHCVGDTPLAALLALADALEERP